MKRILYISLLCLLMGSVFGQSTYNKVLYYFGDSLNSSTIIEGVTKLDSNYFLAAIGSSNNMSYGLHIIKTDLFGNRVNAKQFLSDTIIYTLYGGNPILIDNDSNILICANVSDTITEGIVIKLNRDLDTLWTHKYSLPLSFMGCIGDHLLFGIKQCSDGNYIITAKHHYNCNPLPENVRTHLIKINKSGAVLWYKKYQYYAEVQDIEEAPDSGFVFADFFPYNPVYTLAKTDSLGNIEWERQIDSDEHLGYGAVAIDHDNNIVTFAPYVYEHVSSQTVYYALHILKYDLQGNKIWDKKYSTHKSMRCPTPWQNFELEILPNNDILVVGTANLINPFDTLKDSHKGIMIKLNTSGDSLWSRYYEIREFKDKGVFNDIVPGIDGGFLAVGYHKPYGNYYNYGAWLVKMDSLGYAPGAQTVDLPNIPYKQIPELHVYPNPAKDRIHVDWNQDLQHNAELIVFNSLGQELTTELIPKGSSKGTIITSSLQSGIYYIELHSKDGLLARSKFMKN